MELTLKKSEVPAYLSGSDFFSALQEEEEFTIQKMYLKLDPFIATPQELRHSLETVRFWGLRTIPRDIIDFLVARKKRSEDENKISAILAEFNNEIPLYRSFQSLKLTTTSEKEKSDIKSLLNHAFCGDSGDIFTLVKVAAENGLIELFHRTASEAMKTSTRPLARVTMSLVVARGHADCLHFLLKNNCRKEYDICVVAAANGRVDCLQLMCEHGYALEEKAVIAAARNGHFDCLLYAHAHGFALSSKIVDAVAAGGSIECMNYVLEHGAILTSETLTAAAANGHMAFILLLQERGCSTTTSALCAAARGGHLHCLTFLTAQGAPLTNQVTASAAVGGHIGCLAFLHEHNCPWDAACVTAAATAGHLPRLTYLVRKGCPVDSAAVTAATTNGHALCLALLLKINNLKIPDACVDRAARRNDTQCLQLLYSAGVPLDLTSLHSGFQNPNYQDHLSKLIQAGYRFPSSAAKAAIEHRNIACLRYMCTEGVVELTRDLTAFAVQQAPNGLVYLQCLHEYNCPWDVETCAKAAEYRHLDCLKFAHEQGCPWDVTTILAAIATLPQNPECLNYALENGCPMSDRCLLSDIVRPMLRIAVPLTVSITNQAVASASLDDLKFVVDHGAPMDAGTCAAAARYRPAQPLQSLALLEYLHSQGCPWDERTSVAAASHPTAACLRFVHQQGCPWSHDTVLAAASQGAAQCLQYAIQQGCPYDAAVVVAAAVKLPSAECLHVLHRAGVIHWTVPITYTLSHMLRPAWARFLVCRLRVRRTVPGTPQ